MESFKVAKIIKIINAIDALGLGFLLLIAFALQIGLHELPCPLCILQRVGILGIAFGFLLNVKFNLHPVHYALSLLAALLTALISIRQITLHILPGNPGYGFPFLGLHLYTWVFLLTVIIIAYIAILFSISPQYSELIDKKIKSKRFQSLAHIVFAVVFLIAIFNGISTYLETGAKSISQSPVKLALVEVIPLSALFFIYGACVLLAWLNKRHFAIVLFIFFLLATTLVFLYHATSQLHLQF